MTVISQTYEEFMLPLLQLLSDKKEHTLTESSETLADIFDIPPENRIVLLKSKKQTILKNRVGWARTYMQKAGLVNSIRRGVFEITERGLKVLNEKPDTINFKYLLQFPEFVEFKQPTQGTEIKESIESPQTPDDLIESGYQELRNTLENDLLEKIKNCEPMFFEQLILDLMKKMDYGVDYDRIGKTGDGGVDGVVKEDHLGLGEIYLQAKKWEANVRSNDIRDFAGALQMKKSTKGVFITTSDFSQGAYQSVKEIPTKIRLVNGKELVKLMIDYNLGVQLEHTYEVKRLDDDYFSSE